MTSNLLEKRDCDSHSRQLITACFLLALQWVGLFLARECLGDDWPQFLGPQRNGISSEKGLVRTWPVAGPKEVYRVTGGVGMSGLAISQGRLVTMVQRDGQQLVIALDARTGKSLWQTPVAPEYRNQMGDGPRATPTIVGDTLYAFSGEGILLAIKLANGDVLWQHDAVKEFGGKTADYGMACSPLVVGENVVVTAGAPKATVVAYDRRTGKLAWQAGNDPTGYSSPALMRIAGQNQVVTFTGASALGLDPATGRSLWRYPYVTDFGCNTATPIAHDEQVFISAGENHGSALLKLKSSGSGFDVEEVWTSQGKNSVLRSEWQTAVLLDGFFYGMDNVGSAGPVTHFTCVNVATGQRVWQEPRFGKGNFIAADGKLFIVTMKGELIIVRATPDKYDELGRAEDVIGSTRQAPALANGLLYLRDDNEIVCFDVRDKK